MSQCDYIRPRGASCTLIMRREREAAATAAAADMLPAAAAYVFRSTRGGAAEAHLAVDPQHQQHGEEEDSPQRRNGELSHSLGIGQKRQARS